MNKKPGGFQESLFEYKHKGLEDTNIQESVCMPSAVAFLLSDFSLAQERYCSKLPSSATAIFKKFSSAYLVIRSPVEHLQGAF